MKYLLLSIIFILSFQLQAQYKLLPAVLIEKEKTDSIYVGLHVNAFNKTLIDVASFNRKPIIAEINGEKLVKDDWVKARDYDYLIFTDFNGEKRVFATQRIITEFKMIDSLNIRFIEQLYEGNINWIRDFEMRPPFGDVSSGDYFYKKGDRKPKKITLFNSYKNRLKKLTKEFPELIPIIENTDYTNKSNIIKILKRYDRLVEESE